MSITAEASPQRFKRAMSAKAVDYFKKGHKKLGGRAKGTPNKWNFPDIKEICRTKNYDPLLELIDLIPILDPKTQAAVHMSILPYTRAKPRAEIAITGGFLGLSNPLREKPAAELIELLPVTNAPGQLRPSADC